MKPSISVRLQYVVLLCLLYTPSLAILYMYNTTVAESSSSLDGVRLIIILLLAPIFAKYVIQLSTAPFYSLLGRIRQAKGEIPSEATVSVLIPAWNEEVGIIKTLKSVLNTQYGHLEVIVINDGSTDYTHKLAGC
jgi:poly-beta-1,6-N-acetyl-D-glucosamine synthase